MFLRTVVQKHGYWRGKEIPRLAEMLFSVSLFMWKDAKYIWLASFLSEYIFLTVAVVFTVFLTFFKDAKRIKFGIVPLYNPHIRFIRLFPLQ